MRPCPGCTNLADGFPWDFGLTLTEEQAQQIPIPGLTASAEPSTRNRPD